MLVISRNLGKLSLSVNKINFVTREEILHRIEIESATKAKKIVDKPPKV